jgi:hypothetical protein
MNECLVIVLLIIYMIFLDDYKLITQMFILGLIDNHLKMIERPKSKWLTTEE